MEYLLCGIRYFAFQTAKAEIDVFDEFHIYTPKGGTAFEINMFSKILQSLQVPNYDFQQKKTILKLPYFVDLCQAIMHGLYVESFRHMRACVNE